MPRPAVKSLKRMIDQEVEEFGGRNLFPDLARRLARLQFPQQLILLAARQADERFAEQELATLVHSLDPEAVKVLIPMKVAPQLAIDEIHHTRLRGPWIPVRGNDPLAQGDDGLRFGVIDEPPRAAQAGHVREQRSSHECYR